MADLAVERLCYSKPPPGYSAHVLAGASGVNSRGESRVVPSQHATMPPVTPLKCGRDFDWYSTQDASTAAAWVRYKAHDPPGMWIERVRPPEYAPRGTTSVWWTYYVGGGGLLCLFAKPDEVAARAAAWSWYDRRLALAARLNDEDADCGACAGEVVPPEALAEHEEVCISASHDVHDDGGGRCNTCGAELPPCSACGPYHGRRPPCETAWPRCLIWPDDQVAEVERWLVDSTAEIPEVLRG